MKEKTTKEEKRCDSCGGTLRRKDEYTCQCVNCGQVYYISAKRIHKVNVRISGPKLIVLCAGVLMGITAVIVLIYNIFTGILVSNASRFSVAYRDFVMEVYDKPAAKITEEDLEAIRFLRIEKYKNYQFTYSFEDYYAYEDQESFEKTLKTIEIEAVREDFSPANLEYFTGLTRVELYVEGWENYVLPEENRIRYIYCQDALSRYGTPRFFNRLNPDTVEEVVIDKAQELKDFSFLSDLAEVQTFTVNGATLKQPEMFDDMVRLENLTLLNAEMEEDKAYEIVEHLLTLPSLESLTITGSSVWYVSEEEWFKLQKNCEGRITIRRE